MPFGSGSHALPVERFQASFLERLLNLTTGFLQTIVRLGGGSPTIRSSSRQLSPSDEKDSSSIQLSAVMVSVSITVLDLTTRAATCNK